MKFLIEKINLSSRLLIKKFISKMKKLVEIIENQTYFYATKGCYVAIEM